MFTLEWWLPVLSKGLKLLLPVLLLAAALGGAYWAGYDAAKSKTVAKYEKKLLLEAGAWQLKVSEAKTRMEVQSVQINTAITLVHKRNLDFEAQYHEALQNSPDFAALRRPAPLQRLRRESREASAALAACAYGNLSDCP